MRSAISAAVSKKCGAARIAATGHCRRDPVRDGRRHPDARERDLVHEGQEQVPDRRTELGEIEHARAFRGEHERGRPERPGSQLREAITPEPGQMRTRLVVQGVVLGQNAGEDELGAREEFRIAMRDIAHDRQCLEEATLLPPEEAQLQERCLDRT